MDEERIERRGRKHYETMLRRVSCEKDSITRPQAAPMPQGSRHSQMTLPADLTGPLSVRPDDQ